MKPEQLPPLPTSVSALFDAERAAFESPPAEVRADLAHRLISLGPALPPSLPRPVAPLGSVPVGKALALVLIGGLAGSLLTILARPAPKAAEVRVVSVEPAHEAPLPASSAVPTESAEAQEPTPTPPSAISSVATTTDRSLARERALVEKARSAIIRGDGATAILATADHLRQFPDGRLAEEREALAVQALMLVGRPDEAHDRAKRFRARYPNGLFLPVVEAAIGP
jgi:hypothetical protein